MEKSNKISVNYLYKRFHIFIFAITLLIVFGFALTFSKIEVKAYENFDPNGNYNFTLYFNDGSNQEKRVGFYKDKALTQWIDVDPSESFWGFDNGDGKDDSTTIIGDTGATGEPTLTFNWGFSFYTDAPVAFSLLGDGVKCENLTIKLNNSVYFNANPTVGTLPNVSENDVEKQIIGIEAKTKNKEDPSDYYTTLKIKGSGYFGSQASFQPYDEKTGSPIEVPNVKCTGISTGAIINDSGSITLAPNVSTYTIGAIARGIVGDVTINNGYLQMYTMVSLNDITSEAYETYGDSLAYGILGDVIVNGGGGSCNVGGDDDGIRGYGVSGNMLIKGGSLSFEVRGNSQKGKSFGSMNGSITVEDGELYLRVSGYGVGAVGMELSKNQHFIYKGGNVEISGGNYGNVIYDPADLGKMESEIDYEIGLGYSSGNYNSEIVDRKIPIKQFDVQNAYTMQLRPYTPGSDSGKITYDENDIKAVNSIIENNPNISWQKDEPKTWDFYEGKTKWELNDRVLHLKTVDLSGEKLSSASIDLDGQNLNNGLSELTKLNLSNNKSLGTGSILNLKKLSMLFIDKCSLTSFGLKNLDIDSSSYSKDLFDGSNQEVSLTLDESSKDKFETTVTLNNPIFYLDNEHKNVATDISYEEGKLNSSNSKLATIYYVAETGIKGANIEGKMNLTYKVQSEEPTTVTPNDETNKPGDTTTTVKPEETNVPSKTPDVTIEKVTTTSDNTSKNNSGTSGVSTGDTSNTLPWVILSVAMLVVVSTIVVKKMKDKVKH
ncbi:MAG: hypothetical protein LBM02_07420 [Lachnospiraceae bacterium]|jgi:hypothetical protein|nr:hypothetical protein [Lachnospiraceae bacterium]